MRNEYLLRPENLRLAPQERLKLLIEADYYPIVTKRTSTDRQLKEMINLYNFYSIAYADFFNNKENEHAYFAGIILEINSSDHFIGTTAEVKAKNEILADNFNSKFASFKEVVNKVDLIEKGLIAVRNLFFEYFTKYPDIYEKYQLDNITDVMFIDIPDFVKFKVENNPKWVVDVFKYWGIELKLKESSN